jgi:hypothetical protein
MYCVIGVRVVSLLQKQFLKFIANTSLPEYEFGDDNYCRLDNTPCE